MREIKFRGIYENGAEWEYGDLIHHYKPIDGVIHKTAIRCLLGGGLSYPIPVKHETVGQFTGLYDKDGREIYDGDIKDEDGEIVEVWFQDGIFGSGIRGKTFGGMFNNYGRVIGNIHEHPELLNQQTK